MYRCSECGAEYEIKPDYCDCGNDNFIQINSAPKPDKQKFEKQIEIKTEIPRITLTAQKAPEINKPFDIASLSVFIFFVVLAVFTAFYPVKDDETPSKTPAVKNEQVTQNIPSVDSFWDNTPVKLAEDTPQNTTTEEEKDPLAIKLEQWLNKPKVVIEEPQINIVQPQPKQIKKVQPVQTAKSQPNVQQTPKQQQQPVQKTAASNNKPTQDTSSKDLIARVQKNAQTSVTGQTTQKNPVKTTPITPAQIKVVKTQSTQPAPQTTVQKPQLRQYEQVKSKAELAHEVAVYKAALRNNIGRKINFANVVGDGNCSVTFKIDSSGKLLNRNFSVQSPNITLNDAVFSAMKSTTSFNPPPEGYKGETLTLRVNIYNGNFEITLN